MKNLILTLFFAFCTFQVFSLVVPSGTVLTVGGVNYEENIIVRQNATLIISGGITFGHSDPTIMTEYYILIEDGGKVFSGGGSCTGNYTGGVQKTWRGFCVEATEALSPSTDNALELENFHIRHAFHGLELLPTKSHFTGQTMSRSISLNFTYFQNNNYHIFAGHSDFLFGPWNPFDN